DSDLLRRHNRDLAAAMASALTAAWGTAPAVDASLRGSMATVRLPLPGTTPEHAKAVHDRLIGDFKVEVPVTALQGALWCRISAQIYNEPADYQRLADAVLTIARG
ncbi:MAG: aminotransferase class V-fold PLP-dependent enzyme, partial [Alphaproteobacteria bacterium]|nr:aminotransferase class V-fold PLP-dependent enzyme [Alphaproteobacteria bacterium]